MPLVLFLVSCLAVVATALSHVATPWMIGKFIDAAPRKDVATLWFSCAGLFGAACLASLGGGVRSIAARRLADLLRAHVRTRLMEHVLALPVSAVEGHESRQLNSVFVDDVAALATMAQPVALNGFLAIVQLVSALSILIGRYRSFSWLVLIVVPINMGISAWKWPRIKKASREQLAAKARLDSLTSEVVEGARDLKSLAANRSIMNRVNRLTAADMQSRLRSYIIGSVDHGRFAATWLVMSGLYFLGGLAVMKGSLTIGSLTAFIWYVGFLETPISRLLDLTSDYQNIGASLERYAKTLNLDTETEGSIVLGNSTAPELRFRNVTFSYPGCARPALTDVDFTIQPGQDVAIVGASGAGKTTLVSMVLRLFDPRDGAVTIGGTDIRRFTLSSLRRYVAIISQEPFILDGTIRDNIRFGLEDCPQSEVEWAASVADADGFIQEMPDGYDTMVGARGTRLSGGQKRRIAIARAIIRKPRILILDEVTGALDSNSDVAIQRAIERIRDGCTTITISHRLSSTAAADQIVMMKDGQVIGVGTHRRLLRDCPAYRVLAQLQDIEQLVQSDTPGELCYAGDPAAEPEPAAIVGAES
jgi:ABC-type multidrug transport system fused ATPase/permease subunit